MRKILLASNNQGKVERFKRLIFNAGLEIEIVSPADLGLAEIDVVEDGATLADNAELKAKAYFGKANIPILANDTGFWLETEGMVDAPKRQALQGQPENNFSKEEISTELLNFWKDKATNNGGQINSAWLEAFVLINADGSRKIADSRREVILTDMIFGEPHLQMPIRALYISKATNRPSIQHTDAEELIEMEPVITALRKLFVE